MDWAPRAGLRFPGLRSVPLRGDAFLADVVAGLSQHPRRLPSQYFYDARGSRLFQWITRLPDYYLTRVEREILDQHGATIVAALGDRPCTVVDLGAGDGHKTLRLLQRLVRAGTGVTYAPVDLSQAALDEAATRVGAELPDLPVRPLRAAYSRALWRLSHAPALGAKLVLFLGSSIGNFEHAEARTLLRELRGALRPGDLLLVGFDLVKPLPLLRRAYDDPQGVTRAFNLNLLARINRELGADFDLGAFRHLATWDPGRPAMESWLESSCAQAVRIAGRTWRFAPGERVHTEISCKYSDAQVTAFASDAGFGEVGRFSNPGRWFVDVLWRVDP
jgi:L-histidine N-alpha-methyltransferase